MREGQKVPKNKKMSANRSKIKEQMPKGTQIQSNKRKKKKKKKEIR
jgi:hypothetical protein